jgi:acyl phosphate:glycerol-3-phosphate acyltransferase
MNALPWLIVPAAYFLGGISAGYWIVRLRTGEDVRAQGSGATGASNAARLVGARGFIAVMVLDAIKGAVAAGAARAVGLDGGWEFAAALAVVAGHIWPVQLGFRGGRGLSPLLGAWLVFAPLAIFVCLVIAGIAWAISRRRIHSGILGTLFLPATTWWQTESRIAATLTVVVAAIVIYAHRSHFQKPTTPPAPA